MKSIRSAIRGGAVVVTLLLFSVPTVLYAQNLDRLAERGQSWLEQVEEQPDRGNAHVPEGIAVAGDERFPTSGRHWPSATDAGFYKEAQPKGGLIHALEHGLVVAYYDEPGFKASSVLQRWGEVLAGRWSGLIAVPHDGLEQSIVLTAWTNRLDLPQFDEEALAAFIDEFSGRGPENPVR